MTVNIEDVPKELWKEFGIQALKEEMDKKELFRKAIKEYLINAKEKVK